MDAQRLFSTLRQQLPAQYVWPVLLLVGTCFGCLLAVLFVTTQAQDRLQLARERQSVEEHIERAPRTVAHDLQDYAKWDEAVLRVTRRGWLSENVVAHLGGGQGYSVMLLDPRDRLIVSDGAGAHRDRSQLVASPGFRRAIAAVRSLPADEEPILSGFALTDDGLQAYAVGRVVPLTLKVRPRAGPTYLLAITQNVGSSLLQQLRDDHQIRGLKVHPVQRHGPAEVALRGIDGEAQAWLSWRPARPGTELRRDILPLFLFVGLLTLAAASIIIHRGAQTVEALRRSEADARDQAFRDAVTGLPNRRALTQRIRQLLGRGATFALLSMDLDGFKGVNDLYGHAAGDAILREVHLRIRNALPQAVVARIGGDEFAALLDHAGPHGAQAAAEAILASFAQPFSVGTYRISIGTSIGIAQARKGEPSESEILRRADTAMYAAKGEGKGRYRHFEPQMDQLHHLRLAMGEDLRAAIEDGGIDVVYQPVVASSTGRICSVEALSCWSHPVHGAVPPEIFIPLAEQSGMINALGRHVLRTACREVLGFPFNLCVNLSPAQFWDPNMVAEIRSILADTGFPPERLEVEITESYLLRQPNAAAEKLVRLRALGIKVALDDFGTGYGSIGYLRRLPFDRLKIDREFIAPLAHGSQGIELVAALVALATSLGLEITAEGVETEEQARLARLAGCSQLQGWLFGRPTTIQSLAAEQAGVAPVASKAA